VAPTIVTNVRLSDGLNNGDLLQGSATCLNGLVIAGGYSIIATRPEDLEKLIPARTFPSDPQTWTVSVVANAATQGFALTIYATCGE
jgi:hypothetical protein